VDEVKKHFPQAQITFNPSERAAAVLNTIPKRFMNDRAEKEWGWRPSYSLASMVADFIEELKGRKNP
jgi:nucleoside-diphosphate-sugar epimerase